MNICGGENATVKSRLSKYQAYQSHFSPRISLHRIIYVNHSFCPRWEATSSSSTHRRLRRRWLWQQRRRRRQRQRRQSNGMYTSYECARFSVVFGDSYTLFFFFLYSMPLVPTVKRAIIFPVSTCVHKMWCMHKWIYLNRINRNANETRLFIQCTRMNGLFRYACADDISLSIALLFFLPTVVSFCWLCFFFSSTLTISLLPS